MNLIYRLIPGFGINGLQFGMDLYDIINVMGRPDAINEDSYGMLRMSYGPLDLGLDKDYLYRLTDFLIEDQPDVKSHIYVGNHLVQINKRSVFSYCKLNDVPYEVSYLKDPKGHCTGYCIDVDRLNLTFGFYKDKELTNDLSSYVPFENDMPVWSFNRENILYN